MLFIVIDALALITTTYIGSCIGVSQIVKFFDFFCINNGVIIDIKPQSICIL